MGGMRQTLTDVAVAMSSATFCPVTRASVLTEAPRPRLAADCEFGAGATPCSFCSTLRTLQGHGGCVSKIQSESISLWDSLMFGRLYLYVNR